MKPRCLDCVYCRRTEEPHIVICLRLLPRKPEAEKYCRCMIDTRVLPEGCKDFIWDRGGIGDGYTDSGRRAGLMVKESDIRRQIKQYMEWNGWTVLYHLQGLGSFRGMSDLQCLKKGRCVFLEIKRPNGKQSEYQKKFQELVESAGFEYVLAKSIDDVEHLCGKKQLKIKEQRE